MAKSQAKISLKRITRVIISITSFLVCWEAIARAQLIHISLLPPPTYVARALIEMALGGDLLRDVQASLWRALIGFVIGSAIGIAVGVITGRISIIDHYLSPLILLFRPLPPVAIIPLVIIWFGIGEMSKIFSISFAVFFPVWVNAHIGASQVPRTFLWSAQTLNVRGLAVLWKVILPGALPFVVAGLRTGIAVAFIMVFVAELAGASAGVGYQISVSQLAYRVDRMIAALIVLGVLGAGADILLTRLIRKTFPWLQLSRQN